MKTALANEYSLKPIKAEKAFIKEGIIENSYPSIFIIKFENEYEMTRRVSYSYTDILTKAVELVIYKDDKEIMVS